MSELVLGRFFFDDENRIKMMRNWVQRTTVKTTKTMFPDDR